mmetsp:Transcript_21755/g.45762  ORF Transcript_21755/g.45762 Transcript_21755/m.45762 type:complete len:584 (-) Transcript_21755:73-1824(-)
MTSSIDHQSWNTMKYPKRFNPRSNLPRRLTSRSTNVLAIIFVATTLQINIVSSLKDTRITSRRPQRGGFNECKGIESQQVQTLASSSFGNVSRGGGSSPSPASRLTPKLIQSMRLLYLTYYASLGALMPYLPVYFHSLGHAGTAIGILGAVKPLTTFLVAPLWGIMSDRSGNHVATLQFTFVTSLIFQLLVGVNSNLKYLIMIVFVTALLNAPVKSLIDSIVMSKLTSDEDRHQFGRMRLWGQIGFGVGSSLVGSLLSIFPSNSNHNESPSAAVAVTPTEPTLEKVVHTIEVGIEVASETDAAAETGAILTGKANSALIEMTRELLGKTRPLKGYEWAFLTHAVLSIPVYFCIRAFRPETTLQTTKNGRNNEVTERKTTNIMDGLRILSKNSDALIFFFLVFVIGTSSGCIENFAYVRIGEVGGTGHNMGICRLISSLAGAPMFWFSGPLTEALGVDVVLVLSLLAYVIRFLNYAFMKHPYHALLAEALRGITFAAFWSSGSMYAHKISPPGMSATMLLIMNAMYGGLGQSLGAVIGGKLQSNFGTVKTFIYSGIFDFCFVGALVTYLLSKKERAFTTTKKHP